MAGITLDAGGMIALDRNDRRMLVLLTRASEAGARVKIPATGTSDIAAAHVVICARRTRQRVVTSDPGDLRVLDPAIDLITV